MKAVAVAEFGGPENLHWTEVADPECGPEDVIIDVVATAVNRADVLQRKGLYPPPAGESDILGLECSGVISAVGSAVTGAAIGDEVCALLTGGGYAQRVAVPAGQVMPVPTGLTLDQAAALPEVACTVWSNLTDIGDLQAGETVLIHGGAGGIGTFAIQYAKALGATVITTAGSQPKLDLCANLGADVTINYREQDFAAITREQGGADVILDNMGAKYLDRNINALAADGHLVVIGMQGGIKAELNLAALIRSRGSVHATSLRSRSRQAKARICDQVVTAVWPLIADGQIRPVIDRVVAITDVAAAHAHMEASDHAGKIVMRIA